MGITHILADLRHRNITVRMKGADLCVHAHKDALSPEIRAVLANHKQEIVKYLQQLDAGGHGEINRVADRKSPLPLSFAQQRLWFIHQLESGIASYNVPQAVRLKGPLDIEALENSLAEIVRRHEPLRTIFVALEGEPRQIIQDGACLEMPIFNLASIADQEHRESEVRKRVRDEAQKSFDLEHGPLLRAITWRLGKQDHVLLLAMHHIVSDAWSIEVLMRELSILYEAYSTGKPCPLPELYIQYADFTMWEREWLQGAVLEEQLNYWKRQLVAVQPLALPTDRPRPAVMTHAGASLDFSIGPEQTSQLKKLGRRHEATLYVTLLAAFQVLLSRYSGQQDIAVGSPIAGRRRTETEALIGCFINTLVMRADVQSGMGFDEFLGRVKEITLEAYAHQDVPFEKVVEELQPERDLSRAPMFQVMLILQNAPRSEIQLGRIMMAPFVVESHTAKFDLTLTFWENYGRVSGSLVYNTDLFDSATVKRMMQHYVTLLDSTAGEPARAIAELPMLPRAERQQLLVEWNQTAADFPQKFVHQMFAEQARKTAEKLAVEDDRRQLTYGELHRHSNQLGRFLRKFGVGPEVRVGICMERGAEMVAGLMGILKAGGAYISLDPTYPQERLAYMLEDSQASVLLTQEKLLSRIPAYTGRVLNLDRESGQVDQESSEDLIEVVRSANAAYLIYTSGSTGTPKGSVICHHNVAVFADWAQKVFSPYDLDGVLASTSICFDLSVFEIFVPLTCGGRVIVANNVLDLATMSPEKKVTLINTVPSAARELVRVRALPASVRTMNLAGEALPQSLVDEIYELGSVDRVFNLYGPSEDTTYSTYALMSRGAQHRAVPIGRPVENTQVYVLDGSLNPAPIGVAGELCIGGAGLARGYFNRPALTAEKFIPNPFSLDNEKGGRLYRTGDLARWRVDGNLEYLGRMDHQVKIRGFRVEPGEIEAVLKKEKEIDEVTVMAGEDEPGEKRLVAYIVTREAVTAGELREKLKQKLPDYMLPSIFVPLQAMPLTPNGKIDRLALAKTFRANQKHEQDYVAPQTANEEILAQIWSELLKVDRPGINSNFFTLGGHSLLMFRLKTMIHNRLDHDLSLANLFRYPTIAGMAKLLEIPTGKLPSSILVPMQVQGSRAPFFCVHPIGGEVACYSALFRELGSDQPFYGLQSPNPSDTHVSTIEQMASLYIQEIRRVQARGPYQLGGWSMGGLIALDMAHQLIGQGETVALLALFDAFPPLQSTGVAPDDNSSAILEHFAGHMSRILLKNSGDLREQFLRLGPQEQLKLIQDALVREQVLPQESAESELNRLLEVFTRNSRAMNSYQLRPIDQRIVLFLADGREPPECMAERWKPWTAGVEWHAVPGDHYTVLQPPHVSTVAAILTNYLNPRHTGHQQERSH